MRRLKTNTSKTQSEDQCRQNRENNDLEMNKKVWFADKRHRRQKGENIYRMVV